MSPLDPAVVDAVQAVTRLCACGCGERIVSTRPNARYASDACRSRAWKAKAGYRDPRRAQPYRNGSRRPDAARRKPSVRISYRKAVDAVTAALEDPATYEPQRLLSPRERAEAILEPLLTPAGRRALS